MSSVILRNDLREKIKGINDADILVGIPSYNNARTIGHVVEAVQAGLSKYFPDKKAVFTNSDGGSFDGTVDVVRGLTGEAYKSIFLQHRVGPVFTLATPYQGIPGKGSALKTIFEIADALNVKACAVFDSDLRSITPEWVELLLRPVLERDFDYVLPLYHRHKYDGTLTNSVIYPLTRALYGKQMKQSIGGDFAFSGKLAKFYLTKDVWESDVSKYGIDIWMTTTAIANGFKVCQSFLGARTHEAKDPGADLSAMLYQVVGTTVDLMEEYSGVWKKAKGSGPVATFGSPYAVGLEPMNINVDRMIEKFRLGVKELIKLWEGFISRDIAAFLRRTENLQKDAFHIPDEVWAEIVYSFAIAAHRKIMNREHLLKSLTPLYMGKTASFVMETRESDAQQVEQKFEQLCKVFENSKLFLNVNWQ
jgi:glycosyltransferase involved in cell wall biosynthesis